MRVGSLFVLAACCVLAASGCKSSHFSKPVDDSIDWSLYGGSHEEQRFSNLKQINEQNVEKLGLVWSHEFGTHRGLEATPLVVNGVIYTTVEWSVVYALDARTGRVLW